MAQPSLPLGFDKSTTYVTAELPIVLGDRLYLLSDGLYEIPDRTGELWGQGRLDETIRRFGDRPLAEAVSGIIAESIRWQGHEQFPDDVALMGVEIAV
jgi:sigma-B regulation protein RsbU (phosphoserine phosphatase)